MDALTQLQDPEEVANRRSVAVRAVFEG
jgi:hypothetical protein